MPRLRTLLCATLIGGAATGCFLTTSFDGLSSGAPAEPDPTPEGDAGPPRDAGKPKDGSVTDAPAGDAADDRPFCVREQGKGHLLCSDFSTGTPLDGVWNQTLSEGAGKVVVDPALKALISTTEPVAADTNSKGILIFKMQKTIAKATIALDMTVEACAFDVDGTKKGQATLVSLGQGDDQKWIVGMILNADGFIVNHTRCSTPTDCQGTSTPLASGLSIAKRSRIVQTIDVTSSKMTVSVDGTVALNEAPVTLVSGVSQTLLLNIGAANRGPSKGCRVVYDNVTLDVQ